MKPVASAPYAWPFDGAWSAHDSALIVVDMQRWLLAALPALEIPVTRLVTAVRDAGIPVFFTRRLRPEGVALRRAQAAAVADALPPVDGEGLHIASSLSPPGVGDLFDRMAFCAFHGTALDHALRLRGTRNLILCGATTDGAVHATMREANDRGYECLLVEDACAATDPAHHDAILRITRFGNGLFGCTAPLAAVLEAMG
jgi:biuret amidohydrolase